MRPTVRWLTVIVVLVGLVAVLSGPPDPLSGDLASAAQAPVRAVAHVVDHGCSNRTLKGPFGFSFSGTAVAGGFEGKPGAVVGLMTFDGQGNSRASSPRMLTARFSDGSTQESMP